MQSISSPSLPAFGPRLRQMRRAAGVKQSALSNELNIDQSTLSRWEGGIQSPEQHIQQKAFDLLANNRPNDFALRRLVESSNSSLHLIEDATHRCLAFSIRRAKEWGNQDSSPLIGQSLWRFATEEIQAAENDLTAGEWWSTRSPTPQTFKTSKKIHNGLAISEGRIVWERMYLSDGTPVRLCTSLN
ncbi:MAG: transcriptional regulator [Rhizobiaceae bacterium]|nr:transcriptional regulator [Rhizobiaceae bacterium]